MRMQLLSSLLVLAAAIPFITCGGQFGIHKEGNRTLVLLHTSDDHSRLFGVGPEVDGSGPRQIPPRETGRGAAPGAPPFSPRSGNVRTSCKRAA